MRFDPIIPGVNIIFRFGVNRYDPASLLAFDSTFGITGAPEYSSPEFSKVAVEEADTADAIVDDYEVRTKTIKV